jgi:hypothetical protein
MSSGWAHHSNPEAAVSDGQTNAACLSTPGCPDDDLKLRNASARRTQQQGRTSKPSASERGDSGADRSSLSLAGTVGGSKAAGISDCHDVSWLNEEHDENANLLPGQVPNQQTSPVSHHNMIEHNSAPPEPRVRSETLQTIKVRFMTVVRKCGKTHWYIQHAVILSNPQPPAGCCHATQDAC